MLPSRSDPPSRTSEDSMSFQLFEKLRLALMTPVLKTSDAPEKLMESLTVVPGVKPRPARLPPNQVERRLTVGVSPMRPAFDRMFCPAALSIEPEDARLIQPVEVLPM